MTEQRRFLGAIEAGGTKFVLALAGPDGTIVARERIPTRSPVETFAETRAWFRGQEALHGPIAAFGIASFGPLDIDPASDRYGTIGTTPKPGWNGARYDDALATFGVPFAVDTDVNGAALGEWHAWGGPGTLAYTTVGTGIGTGIVAAGRPLAGFSHYEAGHVRVPHDRGVDPFAGVCRFHGDCLEGLASGPAIQARWGHDLSRASANQLALIAGYLADFAATLVLMHMPDRLVFGGGVMQTPGLLDAVRCRLPERLGGYVPAWSDNLADRLVCPILGTEAGLAGAVSLARHALLTP